MTKVKWTPASRRRRKKFLKLAKGQWGGRRKLYRTARESVQKGLMYAFRDRKAKKRLFRNLWIVRINAACRANEISYSKFMSGLKKVKISIDRKSLADLALNDKKAFKRLVEIAQTRLSSRTTGGGQAGA